MKILKWVILAVVVLVVIGLVVLYFNLNRIIRSTVVTQSQKQLQVDTSLDSAHLSLLGGTLSLNDFALGSPQGFSAPQMFSMGKAAVDVQYGELSKNPIHIRQVSLSKPVLTIEQAGGKLNFKALMDQLPPSDPNAQKSQMSVIIDQLTIDSPQVVIRPGVPGMAQEITLPLPTIDVKNIGSGAGNQNGAALKDVVMTVVNQMAASAAKSDKLPKEVQMLLSLNTKEIAGQIGNMANEQVEKATGKLNEAINKKLGGETGGAVNDALKKATGGNDAGKTVQKGIEGLFGGDKNKTPATKP
jgi:uncharacterized protein involved in outer membrane biogenesis